MAGITIESPGIQATTIRRWLIRNGWVVPTISEVLDTLRGGHGSINSVTLKYSKPSLLQWDQIMNCWGWPGDYPFSPPRGYFHMNMEERSKWLRPHADAITSLTTQKERLHFWNVHFRMAMSEERFEEWWHNNYERDGHMESWTGPREQAEEKYEFFKGLANRGDIAELRIYHSPYATTIIYKELSGVEDKFND